MSLDLPPEIMKKIAFNTDPCTFARIRQITSRSRDLDIPHTTRAYLKELDHYMAVPTLIRTFAPEAPAAGPLSLDEALDYADRLQHAAGLRQDASQKFTRILQTCRRTHWWPPDCTVEYPTVDDLSARIIRLERVQRLEQVRDRLERRGLRICHHCCRTVPKTQGFVQKQQTPCTGCEERRLALADKVWEANRLPLRSVGEEAPAQNQPSPGQFATTSTHNQTKERRGASSEQAQQAPLDQPPRRPSTLHATAAPFIPGALFHRPAASLDHSAGLAAEVCTPFWSGLVSGSNITVSRMSVWDK